MKRFLNCKNSKMKIAYLCSLIFPILITTFFSYIKGEQFYFLIPVLLFSMSYFQWFYFLPVLVTLAIPCKIKYKDLTIVVPPISNRILGNEVMASLGFIIYITITNYFFIGTFIYTLYAIISMTHASIYLNRKIRKEAKIQNIFIKFKNKTLIPDLTEQYWRKCETSKTH